MSDLLRAADLLDRTASMLEQHGTRSALHRPTAELLRAVALVELMPADRTVWNGTRWVRWAELHDAAGALAAAVLTEVEGQ